jgi:PhzF family phenazine biosynthesis protein
VGQPFVQIDAFTDTPFGGNPAAVYLLETAADEAWMQAVAREMNLSETAFLERRSDGWDLRWFTPTYEVDLCGHATLASAHYLWESGNFGGDEIARFHTRSGLLTAVRDGDWIVLDFPALDAAPAAIPDGFESALGVPVSAFLKSDYDVLAEIGSEDAVRALDPDLAALKSIDTRGIIVTARGAGEFDFVSRFFAPRAGVDEDPVTGSAHSVLAPYWAAKLGKTRMLAFQASRRGGVVRVESTGGRVHIGGQAATVLKGTLCRGPAG